MPCTSSGHEGSGATPVSSIALSRARTPEMQRYPKPSSLPSTCNRSGAPDRFSTARRRGSMDASSSSYYRQHTRATYGGHGHHHQRMHLAASPSSVELEGSYLHLMSPLAWSGCRPTVMLPAEMLMHGCGKEDLQAPHVVLCEPTNTPQPATEAAAISSSPDECTMLHMRCINTPHLSILAAPRKSSQRREAEVLCASSCSGASPIHVKGCSPMADEEVGRSSATPRELLQSLEEEPLKPRYATPHLANPTQPYRTAEEDDENHQRPSTSSAALATSMMLMSERNEEEGCTTKRRALREITTQLEQLAVLASPTQKRLLFDEGEEEEEEDLHSALRLHDQLSGDGGGGPSPLSSTMPPSRGGARLRGEVDGRALRCSSGLALLQSRKRCLDELRAEDCGTLQMEVDEEDENEHGRVLWRPHCDQCVGVRSRLEPELEGGSEEACHRWATTSFLA